MLKCVRNSIGFLLTIQLLYQIPVFANDTDDFSLQQPPSSDVAADYVALRFVGDANTPLFEISVSQSSDVFMRRDITLNFCDEFSTKNFSGLRSVISPAYEPAFSKHLIEGLIGSVWLPWVCPSLFEGSDKFAMFSEGDQLAMQNPCAAEGEGGGQASGGGAGGGNGGEQCAEYSAASRSCPNSTSCPTKISFGSYQKCNPKKTSKKGCTCPVSKFVTLNSDGSHTQWFPEDTPCPDGEVGSCGATKCSATSTSAKNNVTGRNESFTVSASCSPGSVPGGPMICECRRASGWSGV